MPLPLRHFLAYARSHFDALEVSRSAPAGDQVRQKDKSCPSPFCPLKSFFWIQISKCGHVAS